MKNNIDFKVEEYINELFNKGKDDIDFEHYQDEDLVSVVMHLNWSENDKDDFINKFNLYLDEIKRIGEIDRSKGEDIFNKYFKDYNKNNYFDNMGVLGSRLNRLLAEGTPRVILENEIKTSINELLLNQFAKDAFITREVSELIEFDNK